MLVSVTREFFLPFNIRQVNIIPNLHMNQFESGSSCCPTWLYNLNDVCRYTFYRMHYVHNLMKWNVITASFFYIFISYYVMTLENH